MDAAAIQEKLAAAQNLKRKADEAPAGAVASHKPIGDIAANASVLNATNPEALATVLSGEDAVVPIKSDADEQLLVSLTLPQTYKLSAITLAGPSDGSAPATVKLFVNRTSMSFDDCEDYPPTQVVSLASESATLPLKFVNFQSVSSLTVFVETNQGDTEATCLSRLGLVGVPVATTNMKDLKKAG